MKDESYDYLKELYEKKIIQNFQNLDNIIIMILSGNQFNDDG